MPNLFFYGTLRHAPLLKIVAGADPVTEPAHLAGHAVVWAGDQPFPMIVAQGAGCDGVLLRDVGGDLLARLDFFEGGFGYALREVTVQTDAGPVPAQVWFPDPGLFAPGAPFDLDDWVARWGQITCHMALEVMARRGHMTARDIRPMLPFFRARGWARQMAQTAAPQTLRSAMTQDDVQITRDRGGFSGFFRMEAFDIRFRRFDGGWTDPVPRESFVAFDAALVLPYDPASDKVLIVEQLRFGPIWRGDPAPWVFEPIAGLVDAGEAPADTARREAVEEAGLTLGDLRPIARVYASPGYSSEFFHCFLGLCDLTGVASAVGGLASESENIRRHVLPFADAMALVDSGEINAGPLVMMLYWLAAQRETLRNA